MTKLGREVALKVLPADVADDGDRLARLEREAKVLASLNHPNIAMLFGLETVASGTDADADSDAGSGSQDLKTSGPVTFLAMELVDGEDLSDRIKRGPIPVDEAIPIALQIARALEAAHQQGIVHRDLKPANIKLTKDGAVKVLDFGLAKAWEAESTDHSLSLSPTMTQHATAAGIILGTAGYMAPEQAAGQGTDTRADVWSFGVVLWEMLTGSKLFDGETVSHVLAAVLTAEPDLSSLPEDTPPRIADLIGRCLRKKPKMRIQAIGDVRIALEEYLADPEGAESPVEMPIHEALVVPAWKRALPWAVGGRARVGADCRGVLAPLGAEHGVQGDDPAAGGDAFRSPVLQAPGRRWCRRMASQDRVHRRRRGLARRNIRPRLDAGRPMRWRDRGRPVPVLGAGLALARFLHPAGGSPA